MGLFDGSGDNSGLMGMYANPQIAGLLGMSQGLLGASGPSRLPVSMGQALGAGMGGMQQGAGNALNLQRQMYQMQALQGLSGLSGMGQGGGQPAGQSMPGAQALLPVSGAANMAGLSGPSAGMGQYAPPTPVSQMPQQQAGQQQPGPTIYGKSPQQLFQQGMMMNAAGIPGGADLMKVAVEHDPQLALQMPTDMQKNAAAAYGNGTPEYLNAVRGVVDKEGIVPLRPGAPYIRGGQVRGTPGPAPQGFMNQPNQDGSWSVVPVPGGTSAVGQSAAAQAGGRAQYELKEVWDPNANGGQGGMVQQTVSNIAGSANPASATIPQIESHGNPNAVSPKGATGAWQVMPNTLANPGFGVQPAADNSRAELDRVGHDYYGALSQRYGDPAIGAVAYNMGPGATDNWLKTGGDFSKLPQETQLYLGRWTAANAVNNVRAQPAAPMASQPPLGAQPFVQGQVKQMQDRWGTLRDQNVSAQTVVSQLQNIATLAPAAITGAEADRRSYMNGLLSLVGVPGAQDAKTATDLLDKYSNQIIAKLGQGGLGTDAARSIVSAGNPNAHMTVPAIQEAVRNLSGQYQMVQAKTGLLQQFANGNDPAGYTKAETAFDKNADPRIWEWQAIQDPAARRAFAAKVQKQDPKFGQKIQTLESLGAFQ